MMGGFELSAGVNADKVFLVKHSELEGRLDSYFYQPNFYELDRKLRKNGSVKFSQLIKSIFNGYDFRDYKEFGTPYIKVANVKQGEFDFRKMQYIEFDSNEISKSIQLKKGNLLLTRKGTFGNALSLDQNYDYVISSEVFYIELNEQIDSKYLEIFFNSALGQKQFDRNKIGAIMGSLSQEAVKSLQIPLPSLGFQEKIVEFYKKAYSQKQQKEQQALALLDSIDGYLLSALGITLPQQDNRLEKRMFTVPFSELVGERIDSIYHHDKTVKVALNNSTYDLVKIKEKCTFLSGYAFSSDDYIESLGCFLVTIKNISKNIIDLSNSTFLPTQFYDDYSRFRIQKDDLVFAMTGATIGKVGIFVQDTKALLNQRNGIIRSDKMNTCFLMNLLNTSVYQSLILKNAVGGAQPNISETAITNLLIPLPPFEKQIEIATHISQIRAAAKQLQEDAAQILTSAKADIERMILGGIA